AYVGGRNFQVLWSDRPPTRIGSVAFYSEADSGEKQPCDQPEPHQRLTSGDWKGKLTHGLPDLKLCHSGTGLSRRKRIRILLPPIVCRLCFYRVVRIELRNSRVLPAIRRNTYTCLGSVSPCVTVLGMTSSSVCAATSLK